MRNLIKRIYKWFVEKKLIRQKYYALYSLEKDLGFLVESNDKIFSQTEEQMRKRMQELEFKRSNKTISEKGKVELAELPGKINKYTSIKKIKVDTEQELTLVKKYIKYLEKK